MSPRVLVVDDDRHILRAIATSLERAGFEVSTTCDGPRALAMTEPFDVVIADYNMQSDVTGADIVRHFKSIHGSAVTCIVLSGADSADTRAECVAAGAEDVLLKPVSTAALRRRLSQVGNRDEAA